MTSAMKRASQIALGAAIFVAGIAAGSLHAMAFLAATMLIAGAAWIVFISLVSALIQGLAPDWVRARVLAVFMLVFQGALAAGSALWGAVAVREGIHDALLWAGLGIVATAALGLAERRK